MGEKKDFSPKGGDFELRVRERLLQGYFLMLYKVVLIVSRQGLLLGAFFTTLLDP